jgi:hypothetical protein
MMVYKAEFLGSAEGKGYYFLKVYSRALLRLVVSTRFFMRQGRGGRKGRGREGESLKKGK